MAAGYCLGEVFTWEEARRQQFPVSLGVGMNIAFVVFARCQFLYPTRALGPLGIRLFLRF